MIVGHVLARLGEHPSRSAILARFRALGGNLDRWARRDVIAMADAITSAEDALESEARGRLTPARLSLRSLRRSLEAA